MSFLRPGEHPDELLSDSLTGDLTDDERARLDAHLAGCPACRDTLAAFTEQRRLVSGLRHVPPPRDLGARVRTRIDSGRLVPIPWWRRPGPLVGIVASAATVAAAALAVSVFSNLPISQTGQTGSPDASASLSASVIASLEPSPSTSPTSEPTPVPVAETPTGQFRYTLSEGVASLVFVDDQDVETELAPVTIAPPVAAAVSSDEAWLSVRLEGEVSDLAETYVVSAPGPQVLPIGRSLSPGAGFGGELAWSPNGQYLAFTITQPEDGSSDVWLFDVATRDTHQLTNTGDAYAGSWMPDEEGRSSLWISRAAAEPSSHLVVIQDDIGLPGPLDPAAAAVRSEAGAFLPLVAPDGRSVIFWRGTMSRGDGRWTFEQGGMPYLGGSSESGELDFEGVPLFPDLATVVGEAFASAQIAWGPDSDAFAIWNAAWTGTGQPAGFPDPSRVYFGHVSNGELITRRQALDPADLEGLLRVVDVAIGSDGLSLAITGLTSAGSEAGTYGPKADLRLVLRAFGDEPDKMKQVGEPEAWNGPAIYDPCCGFAP